MKTTIIPVDLGFVNAYLVRIGESFVLVDTGMASHWAKLAAALAAAGCAPANLKLVILTHADMDHVGNARRLQAEWKVPIAVHAADAQALETGEAPKRMGRGPVAKAIMGALNLVRGSGRRSASICKADLLFEDGERLDAWGLDARIVYLPGHTRGSIAVLTAGGALVAGDVFANRRRPAVSPFIENVVAYRESLFKAKALAASVVTVYPGHGASFPGAAIAGIEL